MLLLWIDILTRTVCAEQAKQQAAQTDKLVPPAEAAANQTWQPPAPRHAQLMQRHWTEK